MLNLNKEISNTADIALCLKSLFVNLYKKAAAKSYSGTVSLLINNNISTINTDSFIESDFTEENFQQPWKIMSNYKIPENNYLSRKL